jgi:hypothetical protein
MTPQRTHQPRNEVVLDHIVRTVYRKYSPEAESSMLGYIPRVLFPPCGSRSPERPAIGHVGATASSTQSPERVLIPKILR